jgi:hypothetical protein
VCFLSFFGKYIITIIIIINVKDKRDSSNNRGKWTQLEIIQKIPGQHIGKERNQRTKEKSYIGYCKYKTAAPKVMPPILLCWPTTSEANVDMAVELEPSRQYSVKFCCRATDDSRGAV